MNRDREKETVTVRPANPGPLPELIDAMEAGDSVRIACYGNSITYGMIVGDPTPQWESYPQKLQKLLRERYGNEGIDVLNCGTPGFTAALAIEAVDTAVIAKKPDLCFLMLGINDCLNGVPKDKFGIQLESLVGIIQSHEIGVVLLTPTHIDREEYVVLQEFPYYVQLASQNRECGFLDMNSLILNQAEADEIWDAQLLPDGVHFAQDKYGMIADQIDRYMGTLKP